MNTDTTTKTKATAKKRSTGGGLVSASEIIKAGGFDKWAKKVGYDSQLIKMSGIITLTEQQVEEAIRTSHK